MPDLRKQFAQPANNFRMMPFWFLNHELEEDELRRQIREMSDKGLGGAVLHARHGLLTEYMSEEWLQAIEVCVEELRAHGMEAWLYDENNWPSGTHGGEVTHTHPDYRMRYLRVQNLHIHGGVTYQVRLPDYGGKLVSIQAVRITPASAESDGPPEFLGKVRDVSSSYEGGRFRWEAPAGEWFVAVFWEFPVPDKVTFFDGSYLDTMNDEAVRAFRKLAYEPYMRLKEHFGETVKGVFTDEPGLMIHDAFVSTAPLHGDVEDPQRRLPGVTLAWTRNMLEDFQTLMGYELGPKLLHLLHDMGSETQKVRSDYYHAIVTWYVQHYHGQLGNWCRQRGLEYIGHTLEDPLWRQIRTQGDQAAVLEQFDRPGFDYLSHGVHKGRILAAKCASSGAHITGKQRVMCEALGGSGHQSTLGQQRADLNFICALGGNMVIPHAFYYSFAGHRKSDWPPTMFYHNAYWPWYRHFADYAARLCVLQSSGQHVCDALVMLPTETMQADCWEEGKLVEEPLCASLLDFVSDELLRLHCDYDYVSDGQLSGATVSGDKLAFGASEEEYGLVVVPACRVMSLGAGRKLKEFYEAGGKLLVLGDLPRQALEASQDGQLRQAMADIFGPADGDQLHLTDAGDGNAIFWAETNPTREHLAEMLAKLISTDVTFEATEQAGHDEIICNHRRTGDINSYLLCNRGGQRQEAFVTVALRGGLEEWQLADGAIRPVEAVSKEQQTTWQVELEAGEARVFVLDTGASPESLVVEGTVEAEILGDIDLGRTWKFAAPGGNVAILDRWQLTAHDLTAGEKFGLHDTPGRVNTYLTGFEVEGKLGHVELVFDELAQWLPAHVGFLSGKRNLEVYVNGQQAPPLHPSDWQDRYFTATDISDLIRPGHNEVQICMLCLLEPLQAISYPLYLVGEFANSNGLLTPAPREISGYYSEHGYPHLPGIGVYSKRVEMPPELLDGSKRLLLDPGTVRDAARTLVNGQEVSVHLWEPFDTDITSYLRAGENELVVEVAGTLANLYGKASHQAGLSGPARIWIIG